MSEQLSTNKSVITVITTTIAILAFSSVGTICVCAYFGIVIPPELNTLAGGLVASLATMLVKTSPSEATKSVNPTAPAPGTPGGGPPAEVKVINKSGSPVPTTEEKP